MFKGLWNRNNTQNHSAKSFVKKEKVYVSNNLTEIRKKQITCGGFSETNMMIIIGSVGEVVCIKNNCVTVEIKGRQFDLHPDLLYSLIDYRSLPAPNPNVDIHNERITSQSMPESFSDNEITSQSMPESFSDNESILHLSDPPKDDEIELRPEYNLNYFYTNTSFHFKYEHMEFFEPPVDQENSENISFDYSFVTITPPSTLQLNKQNSTKNQEEEISTQHSTKNQEEEISTIEYNSTEPMMSYEQIEYNLTEPMMSYEQNNLVPRNTPKSNSTILCHKCRDKTIEFAASCGHLFCEICVNILLVCPVCKKSVCKDFLRIRL